MQRRIPPPLLDKKNFENKYQETAQLIEVDKEMYFAERQSNGLQLYQFNIATSEFKLLESYVEEKHHRKKTLLFSDASGWDMRQYYCSIKLLEHQKNLYIIARGRNGIEISKYNFDISRWEAPWATGLFSNGDGWGESQSHYTTIKAIAHQGKLFLSGRGARGITLYQINPETKSKTLLTSGSQAFGDGWQYRTYFSTIKVFPVDNFLVYIGKNRDGISYRHFNLESKTWTEEQCIPTFTNNDGWDDSKYHSTIQILKMNNKFYACGRGKDGLLLCELDLNKKTYTQLAGSTLENDKKINGILSDEAGWSVDDDKHKLKVVVLNNQIHVLLSGESNWLIKYDMEKKEWQGACIYLKAHSGRDLNPHVYIPLLNNNYFNSSNLSAILPFKAMKIGTKQSDMIFYCNKTDIIGDVPKFQSKEAQDLLQLYSLNSYISKYKNHNLAQQIEICRLHLTKNEINLAQKISKDISRVNNGSFIAKKLSRHISDLALQEKITAQIKSGDSKLLSLRQPLNIGRDYDKLKARWKENPRHGIDLNLMNLLINHHLPNAGEEIHNIISSQDLEKIAILRNWIDLYTINGYLPFKVGSQNVEKKYTLLHLTARLKKPVIMAWLILSGANIIIKNQYGHTPADLTEDDNVVCQSLLTQNKSRIASMIEELNRQIKLEPRKLENYLIRGVILIRMATINTGLTEKEVYLQYAKQDLERLFRMMPAIIEVSTMLSKVTTLIDNIKKQKLALSSEKPDYYTPLIESMPTTKVISMLNSIKASWDKLSPQQALSSYHQLFSQKTGTAAIYQARGEYYLYQVEKVKTVTQKRVILQSAKNDILKAIQINPFDNQLAELNEKVTLQIASYTVAKNSKTVSTTSVMFAPANISLKK